MFDLYILKNKFVCGIETTKLTYKQNKYENKIIIIG